MKQNLIAMEPKRARERRETPQHILLRHANAVHCITCMNEPPLAGSYYCEHCIYDRAGSVSDLVLLASVVGIVFAVVSMVQAAFDLNVNIVFWAVVATAVFHRRLLRLVKKFLEL